MTPLITDGQSRVALETVRSLGALGLHSRVAVAAPYLPYSALAARSRWCAGALCLPEPWGAQRWVEALSRSVRRDEVLVPVATNAVIQVAAHRGRFPGAVAPIPSVETIRRVNHRPSLLEIARRAGVPAPKTYPVRSHEDLPALAADPLLRWPLVVKVCDDAGLFVGPEARYRIVHDAVALDRAYRDLFARKAFPMVQEFIPGDGWGVSLLFGAGGEVLARVVHRRTLEYPARGGPSARCETARWPDLEEAAIALLREVSWVGPAQVEFRRDARDGSFRLLEVNPRLWGSLPLARMAGVNLVGMWYRMGLGERVAPAPPAPAGIRLRFAAMEWASALGQGTWRARLGAVARAASAALGATVRDGIESASDPGPGTCYRADLLRRASARCLAWAGSPRKAAG